MQIYFSSGKPSGSNDRTILLKFIQSMVSVKYLTTINTISTTDKTRLETLFADGYNALKERNVADGSFNFKGYSKLESVWLTAYVCKCLNLVATTNNAIAFDSNLIKNAFEFLKRQQIPEGIFDLNKKSLAGSFIDFGNEHKPNFFLTSFVVISFLENENYASQYKDVIDKALNFIDRNFMFVQTNYEFAIICYALALAKHPTTDGCMLHLRNKATVVEDKTFWELHFDEEKKNITSSITDKIEIASYALLSFLQQSAKDTEVLPIMMWIIANVKQNDGAFSKRDSVATAQALAEAARIYFSSKIDVDLSLSFNNDGHKKIHVDQLQPVTFNLPQNVRDIVFHANGTGFVLLEVEYSFETAINEFTDYFELSVDVKSHGDMLHLTISANIKPDEDQNDDGNVEDENEKDSKTVMEIQLPEGFVKFY